MSTSGKDRMERGRLSKVISQAMWALECESPENEGQHAFMAAMLEGKTYEEAAGAARLRAVEVRTRLDVAVDSLMESTEKAVPDAFDRLFGEN